MVFLLLVPPLSNKAENAGESLLWPSMWYNWCWENGRSFPSAKDEEETTTTTNEKSRDIYSGDHNFNPFHAWSTSYSSSVPSVLCINVWQTGLDRNKVKKKRTRQWGTTEKEKDSDY